jgi:hypothetical protein
VGVAVGDLRREPDPLEQVADPSPPGLLALVQPVDVERLADDLPDRQPRVERGVGILEDHRGASPPRSQVPPRQGAHVGAVEVHPPAGRLHQPQQREPGRRLAAARLADQAERLPPCQGEADPVDRTHDPSVAPATDREVDLEVLDLDQRLAHGATS